MYLRRTILVLLVLMAGCAVIFPKEVMTTEEMMKSRYVTEEDKKSFQDLKSKEMTENINKACPKKENGHCVP